MLGLVAGTLPFLIQMIFRSLLPRNYGWTFGVGWGGCVNGILACVYRYYHEDEETKDAEKSKKFSNLSLFEQCLDFEIKFDRL